MFLGACSQPGSVMIVLERMVCDLETVLHKRSSVPSCFNKVLKHGLTLPMKLTIAHDTVRLLVLQVLLR